MWTTSTPARGRDSRDAVAAAKWLKSRMNSTVGNQRRTIASTGSLPVGRVHGKSATAKKWLRFKNGLDWVITQAEVGDLLATAELGQDCRGLGVNVTEVYLVLALI
ncbi:hypothetical protein ACHAWO_005811 [Cyclotella atomus]|uniref:Uncharacterized protein n=1 Tax=Cyclotella atomus TaxID=382360 RepID=A0ABD3P1T9_9STRA